MTATIHNDFPNLSTTEEIFQIDESSPKAEKEIFVVEESEELDYLILALICIGAINLFVCTYLCWFLHLNINRINRIINK